MGDIIRLLDTDGVSILDSVACDYEDSFCLETFGDLVDMHRNAEPKGKKCFIIARVQTLDPKQPDKAFYSYYNAFHLNKILFQTQNYLGKRFIHRLHVLNPLTNSDIIGNVQYFMVRAEQKPQEDKQDESEKNDGDKKDEDDALAIAVVVEVPQDVSETDPTKKDLKDQENVDETQANAVNVSENRRKSVADNPRQSVAESVSENRASMGESMAPSNSRSPLTASFNASQPTGGMAQALQNRRKSSLRIRLDGSMNVPPSLRISDIHGTAPGPLSASYNGPVHPANWTLAGHVVSEDSEETTPQDAQPTARRGSLIPPNFRKSISHVKRLLPMTTTAVSPMKQSPVTKAPERARAMSLVVSRAEDIMPAHLKNRRRTEFSIPVMAKNPTSPVRVHQVMRAQILPGVITRFTVPVPQEELAKIIPKTYRGHRRSLSYRNAISASGTPASFEEWVRMIQREREDIKRKDTSETGDEYDVVRPFSATVAMPVLNKTPIFGSSLGPIADEYSSPESELPPVDIKDGDRPKLDVSGSYAFPKTETETKEEKKTAMESDDPLGALPTTENVELNVSLNVSLNKSRNRPMGTETTAVGSVDADNKAPSPVPILTVETTEDEPSSIGKDEAEQILGIKIYDAVLFATDNDFLETSKTRGIFRENAIVPEDAKLFEMPPYTGEEPSPPPVEIIEDNLLCDYCYPTPDALANASPFMRIFHRFKCYAFAGFIAILIFVFIFIIVLQGSKSH